MKRILIAGARSYLGSNLEKRLFKEPDKYNVEILDLKNPNWIFSNFSRFDVWVHVAGLAHIKETKKNRDLFFKINTDLVIKSASIAKKNGIKQFVFVSSMSVFGKVFGEINRDTSPNPVSAYGKSKLEAERKLMELEDNSFKVSILRPPLIYGRHSPGNFSKLVKFSLINPFYPKIDNKRSILYIDNFTNFVSALIDNDLSGVFHPHNKSYTSTNDLITSIRTVKNKKTLICKFFNLFLVFNKKYYYKIYGDLYYNFFDDVFFYENISFLETIKISIS